MKMRCVVGRMIAIARMAASASEAGERVLGRGPDFTRVRSRDKGYVGLGAATLGVVAATVKDGKCSGKYVAQALEQQQSELGCSMAGRRQ